MAHRTSEEKEAPQIFSMLAHDTNIFISFSSLQLHLSSCISRLFKERQIWVYQSLVEAMVQTTVRILSAFGKLNY